MCSALEFRSVWKLVFVAVNAPVAQGIERPPPKLLPHYPDSLAPTDIANFANIFSSTGGRHRSQAG